MSEHDHRSGLPRREFLKATGSLVVGFSAAETLAAQTNAANAGRGGISGPPDDAEVDSYVAVHPDNTVTIYSGYVELGQGGPTALRQIAAEELDLDFDQVTTVRNDTFVCTNGATYASMTVAIGGVKLRAAAAEARRTLLTMASDRLKTPAETLRVAKGVISLATDPERSVTYGDLLGGKQFNRKYEPVPYRGIGIELPRTNPDNAPQKRSADYKIVGSRVPRFDIPDKVTGKYVYMQHVRVPGMLHGRVVWPHGQGAFGQSIPKVANIDEQSVRDISGVRIVRRGNFVGVATEREWDAVRAARMLKVSWDAFAPLPGSEKLYEHFRAAKTKDIMVANTGDVDMSLRQGAHTASGTYLGPYQSHGTMAPNCAIAEVTADGALIMCSDQAIYQARLGLAQILGLPANKIRVQYYAGSNTFGSSCYAEAEQAAAIMSKELGKPVRVQLSREDEFGWDNYGPAHLADIRGAVDGNGKILAFRVSGLGTRFSGHIDCGAAGSRHPGIGGGP